MKKNTFSITSSSFRKDLRKLGLFFLLLIGLFLSSCGDRKTAKEIVDRPTVVVLSLDGFRWDYAEHTHTPNLDKIAKNGVVAQSFIPVFPSGTFANHYGMATGLFADNHGIVANRFSCPILEEDYNKGNRSTVRDGRFYGGEPIWATAQKQGLRTAAFYWVGSEADVMGIRPDRWKVYSNRFPYGDRIDTIASWLSLPEPERPHLIMWYYHQVDSDGHRYGPLADSLLLTVQMKDSLIGVFFEKIENVPNRENINFIVVSDHGMAELSPDDRIIRLDNHIDRSWIELYDGGTTTAHLKAAEGKKDSLYEALKKIPNMSVWKRGEMPERFKFGNHPRVHDMLILADTGWIIGRGNRTYTFKGAHGYDNLHPDMHGIFYAMGPDFPKGKTIPSFLNINLYPIMGELLQIELPEHDAEADIFSRLFSEQDQP
ncbi:MAG: alkaline phosphatase family protein [Saprospirales bacterium]|nr:MAG: alkaline phosphatase family protein [Saprospirales bacterium]